MYLDAQSRMYAIMLFMLLHVLCHVSFKRRTRLACSAKMRAKAVMTLTSICTAARELTSVAKKQ